MIWKYNSSLISDIHTFLLLAFYKRIEFQIRIRRRRLQIDYIRFFWFVFSHRLTASSNRWSRNAGAFPKKTNKTKQKRVVSSFGSHPSGFAKHHARNSGSGAIPDMRFQSTEFSSDSRHSRKINATLTVRVVHTHSKQWWTKKILTALEWIDLFRFLFSFFLLFFKRKMLFDIGTFLIVKVFEHVVIDRWSNLLHVNKFPILSWKKRRQREELSFLSSSEKYRCLSRRFERFLFNDIYLQLEKLDGNLAKSIEKAFNRFDDKIGEEKDVGKESREICNCRGEKTAWFVRESGRFVRLSCHYLSPICYFRSGASVSRPWRGNFRWRCQLDRSSDDEKRVVVVRDILFLLLEKGKTTTQTKLATKRTRPNKKNEKTFFRGQTRSSSRQPTFLAISRVNCARCYSPTDIKRWKIELIR